MRTLQAAGMSDSLHHLIFDTFITELAHLPVDKQYSLQSAFDTCVAYAQHPEGWLLIYHGVLNSCNGFVYSAGVALLDIDQPWKVIGRAKPYILNPREYYECVGDVPNVVFPCATLCDADTGRLAIYYGAADTVVALAFAYVDELVDFIKANPWQ